MNLPRTKIFRMMKTNILSDLIFIAGNKKNNEISVQLFFFCFVKLSKSEVMERVYEKIHRERESL